MKKIFILIDQMHSHGGIEKLVSIKANYWSEVFGYEVTIISTEQKELPKVYNLSEKVNFIDLGINFHREISFFHPRNLAKLVRNISKIRKIARKEKPDFILVASHIPLTYVLPFMNTDAKTIKEFHFSKYNKKTSIKEKVFSFSEKFYNYLVVLSDEEKRYYPSHNVVVITNPVEKPGFVPKKVNERQNRAAAVFRITPVKQIPKMIDAWESFFKKNPDWELHLFGTGEKEYVDSLNELVKEKNLENSIFFCGQSSEIFKELNEVKMLLMTSQHECFPMVLLEAASVGVPAVSFDIPTGPRNIITDQENGFLVPAYDVERFVLAMSCLAENKELLEKMSINALKNAERFQLDRIMHQWKIFIFEKK